MSKPLSDQIWEIIKYHINNEYRPLDQNTAFLIMNPLTYAQLLDSLRNNPDQMREAIGYSDKDRRFCGIKIAVNTYMDDNKVGIGTWVEYNVKHIHPNGTSTLG